VLVNSLGLVGLVGLVSVVALVLSSLYILCSRWQPERGHGGTGSGPKAAVYPYSRGYRVALFVWSYV